MPLRKIQEDKQLTDDSIMTFGKKYKGMKMCDVPVEYLHWVWHNVKTDAFNEPIKDYILRNINNLKEENEDLLWDEKPR